MIKTANLMVNSLFIQRMRYSCVQKYRFGGLVDWNEGDDRGGR
jgi:hypothetical protein